MLEVLAWPVCLSSQLNNIDMILAQKEREEVELEQPTPTSEPPQSPPPVFTENCMANLQENHECDDVEQQVTSTVIEQEVNSVPLTESFDNQLRRRSSGLASQNVLRDRLNKLNRSVRRLHSTNAPVRYRHLSDPVYLEWKLISLVIDRLCFCLYFIVIVLAHIFFYPLPY